MGALEKRQLWSRLWKVLGLDLVLRRLQAAASLFLRSNGPGNSDVFWKGGALWRNAFGLWVHVLNISQVGWKPGSGSRNAVRNCAAGVCAHAAKRLPGYVCQTIYSWIGYH